MTDFRFQILYWDYPFVASLFQPHVCHLCTFFLITAILKAYLFFSYVTTKVTVDFKQDQQTKQPLKLLYILYLFQIYLLNFLIVWLTHLSSTILGRNYRRAY